MAQQIINVSSPNDGLGDTLRTSQVKANSNFTELYNNKVDKVTGKGLSDVNFSAADKAKLDSLDPSAGAQSDWDQGDNLQPDYIKNKPTNVSEWANDVGYIEDVGAVAIFARSNGEWINIESKILDGITGTTSGFTAGQTVYALPAGSRCLKVYINGALQYKTTSNNSTLPNRWSQTGDDVTLTKASVNNNYILIEYI